MDIGDGYLDDPRYQVGAEWAQCIPPVEHANHSASELLARRCVNKPDSKDPYFRWLKDGRFRLATEEERAKALEKEAREAARKG